MTETFADSLITTGRRGMAGVGEEAGVGFNTKAGGFAGRERWREFSGGRGSDGGRLLGGEGASVARW